MGHEDRERKFEQALARHLRSDGAGARNEAEARADVRSEPGETELCPDAGTLAAFHEGLLLNEEMNAATEHIGGCSRCQQVLLHLEATDEIPLQVEIENDLKMREPVVSTGASDVDYAARQKPSATIEGQPRPALKAPKDISRGRGFKALRWAAPAGAIAAGLLIWFVTHTNRPVNKFRATAQSENVQVAQEQPRNEQLTAPRPLPASPPAEPFTKTKRLNEPRKDNGKSKQLSAEPDALGATRNSMSDAIASHAALDSTSGANVPSGSRESRDEALQGAAPVVRESRRSSEAKDSVAVASPSPAAPKDSGDAVAESGAPVSGAAKTPAKQSANAKTSQTFGTNSNGDLARQVAGMNRLEMAPSVKKEGLENSKIILAPKGKVRWRLLGAGKIERSSDGGVSWSAQNSGVDVELLEGSAPSEAVCWIVGRGGTILKTSDGGGHWRRVAWPNAGEITGIQAFDAMHAIVYGGTGDIPGRFATNDGGATWFRPNK